MFFPLTVGGVARGEKESEDEKQYEMNVVEEQVAMTLERSVNGLFSNSEKLCVCVSAITRRYSSLLSRPHFFMYYNNTKENKDNKSLKHLVQIMKGTLPPQIVVLSFQRLSSLKKEYLLRLENTADPEDIYQNAENVVEVDLTTMVKSLKVASIVEVSLFGESKLQDVDGNRLRWTGEDGVKSGGVSRSVQSEKKVSFLPLQIRTFLLSE